MAGMENKYQKRKITSKQYELAKRAMVDACRFRKSHKCHKGKKWYTDGIDEGFFYVDSEPTGWVLGRCDEFKRKIAESRKRPTAQFWNSEQASAAASKASKGTKWWVNPLTGEQKRSKEQPSSEFINASRKWYTNGEKSKQFVEGYQPDGFVRGRIINWDTNKSKKE